MERIKKAKPRATILVVTLGIFGALALFGVASAALSPQPSSPTPSLKPARLPGVAVVNPFNVEGPSPGQHSELAVPQINGEVRNVDLTELTRVAPRAGRLASADAASLGNASASIVTDAGRRFFARVEYEGAQYGAIRIESWTPEGTFVLRAPVKSPVTHIEQTTIAGHPALTLFPTSAVVGAKGPREVYVDVNGVYYSILAYWMTSDADMLNFTERLIAEVSK